MGITAAFEADGAAPENDGRRKNYKAARRVLTELYGVKLRAGKGRLYATYFVNADYVSQLRAFASLV